ncbi:hypothetical protein R6Q59_013638 [Mikania micrantha]|uniref:Uncharacterized protein n=1 Tax=Mikania micrantha TaxID=192012 RepID=A0A5N6P4H8_9ASTR|nr:hypothetical protein E3N88_12038 [Mikania micrantha]
MNQVLQSRQFLLSNSLTIDPISSINRLSVRIFRPNPHLNEFHSRKSIITCARTSNKGFLSSQRSRQTLIRLVRFAASNLPYVLPEPFNSVIREFGGGGSGGGSGSYWKGFGWGGFDGGGRKRRVNKKSKFWLLGFAAFCCLGFWWFNLSGKLELKNGALLGGLFLLMLLILIRNGRVPEWVLGFCSGGVLVGLSLDKKDELQKFVRGFKELGISRRRRGRRAVRR